MTGYAGCEWLRIGYGPEASNGAGSYAVTHFSGPLVRMCACVRARGHVRKSLLDAPVTA